MTTIHATGTAETHVLAERATITALVTELAEARVTTDVDWSLTENTRRVYERRMRKAAVESARETANDYAEALGQRIESVVSISDTPVGGGAPAAFARSAAAAGASEVTVAEITVSATVSGVNEAE